MPSKPAILAIDDDPQVLRAVARDLSRRYGEQYRVLRADSGVAALEVVKTLHARDEPIALLLSDQRMPKMDGVAFLREARALFPTAKRALLTAYADTEAAIAAINQSHIDFYLLKPWDPPEQRLYPIIDDLLDDWKAGYRPGFGGLRVVGDRWSALSHEIKDFLARNQIPYSFLDVETNPDAREVLAKAAADGTEVRLPMVTLPEGERLMEPTLAELAGHLGLRTQAEQPFYDLVIVGGGPAGLASAVYGASEGLRTVMIEQQAPGGQAGTSSRIENYLGFPAGLSGDDLARRATTQARRFGVEILTPQSVGSLRVEGPYKHLSLGDGSEIACHTLMLAMGVTWRRLPATGADALAGRGVYYGAAMTEAMHCAEEEVFIVGAGNSAGQAAMFFADWARKVVMVVRGADLDSKMSHYLVDRICSHPKIEVRLSSEITECHGDEHLEAVSVTDLKSGVSERLDTRYLFVFIGAAPCTDWLEDSVARDAHGFVLTGPDLDPRKHLAKWPLERPPFLLETNVPGIFASGDVRSGSVKRVASAVGEGSVAVYFMHRYLAAV